MPKTSPKPTPAERELLGQIARYAERKAVNGVLLELMYSASVGAPVLLVVALGEQALALQQIILKAAVPDEQSLIQRVNNNGSGF